MPELPEVETTMRGLMPLLRGQVIEDVAVRRSHLRFPIPSHVRMRVKGARVLDLARRAKYILVHLDHGWTILVHLGMTGGFHELSGDVEPGPHDHVIFTVSGRRLAFRDPRRFGMMDIARTQDLVDHPCLQRLGPEPLGDDFTGRVLRDRLSGRRGPIKVALLDQGVVAGIGNIYASEALFYARLSPTMVAGSLGLSQLNRLARAIQQVLQAAIAAGGSTLRDYRQPGGELGFFQDQFAVYDRDGQACPGCRCGGRGLIQKIVQGGRATYFCPVRQKP